MLPKIALPLLPALFSSGAIGGSSAKNDRGQELNSYKDLSNVFNWALPAGQAAFSTGQKGVSEGAGDLGTAAGYFKSLTSGSRPDMLQAIAPEATAVTSQADAAKRQLANTGTARGGGVAGANQDIKAKTDASIDAALFGVRPQAAGKLAEVGSAEGSLGLGESSAGLKAADLAETAGTNLGELATKNRTQSQNIHQDTVDTISKGIEDSLGAILGALG
jgi:hypothetical protein